MDANMAFMTLAFLVVLALAFDFMNGFHDAANSIATDCFNGRAQTLSGGDVGGVLQLRCLRPV